MEISEAKESKLGVETLSKQLLDNLFILNVLFMINKNVFYQKRYEH